MMLVLKKSPGVKDYGTRIEDDFRLAFDGRFDVEPGVIARLGKEWKRWERLASNEMGLDYRNRFTVSDEGDFWRVRFSKPVFRGEPGYDRLKGTWTEEIAVYRDCIASNGPIYKKRGVNR
jgi:hypothetical protein